MEDNNDNKIFQNESGDEFEYKYNFINTPWDDRSAKSKIGIISLLVAIFAATLAFVIHNFVTHFMTANIDTGSREEIKCLLVKTDEYKFVARIHSINTMELLCVGAVVGPKLVLANGVCVKAGPVVLRVGSQTEPRCKKGHKVDVVEPVKHEGIDSKHLVMLTTYKSMVDCGKVIKIGDALSWGAPAHIIGRPLRGARSFSRQLVKLAPIINLYGYSLRSLTVASTICVHKSGRCPVRAGDLLVQRGRVIGLAATSTHADQVSLTCFFDLRPIQKEFKYTNSVFVNKT